MLSWLTFRGDGLGGAQRRGLVDHRLGLLGQGCVGAARHCGVHAAELPGENMVDDVCTS